MLERNKGSIQKFNWTTLIHHDAADAILGKVTEMEANHA